MRWKITITLLLLNIITFYGIYHLKTFGKQERKQESTNVLGTGVVDIDRIEIVNRAYKEARILERTNGQWKITKPIEWPANLFAVQRIITQIQFLIHEAKFSIEEIEEAGQTLADYGLEEPNIILKFRGAGGEYSLSIGNTTNLGNRVYVMDPEGKNILVVKETLLDSIAANLDELRTQQIFNIPLFELNKLNVQLLSPNNLKIRLLKDRNSWKFEAPIQTDANNALVNNSINQLTGINIDRIVFGEEAEKAGGTLRNPKMRVTLEGNKQQQTLLIGGVEKIGASEKRYYAQLEDNSTIFTVTAKPFDTLEDAQEALREKQFITINTDTLNNISIEQSEKEIRLQKLESGQWQLLGNDEAGRLNRIAADNGVLNKMRKRLKQLEAISFVSDAPSSWDLEKYGFRDPQRIIVLEGEGKQTLFIGDLDEETGNLYAKLEESPFVYHLSPDVLSYFPVSELSYKDRLVNKLPSGARIKSIKIVNLGEDKTIYEREVGSNETGWEENLKEVDEEEREAVLGIVGNLREFRVKHFLANKFDEEAILDKETRLPWEIKVEAKVILPGGDITKTESLEYYFTKRISGDLQIGGSASEGIIFSVEQAWIDRLFTFRNEELAFDEKRSSNFH